MKKNVGKFFGGLLTFALLTGFYSCSNGSSSDDDIADLPQNITQDIYSGDLITFTATKASKSSNDVNIILKYDRSEKGAKEQLVLSNVELEVNVNNSKINMPDKITFNLEPYSSLDSNYKEGTEETRSEYQKEYKVKLPLNKKISAGDKITLQLKNAQLGGEGLGKVSPDAIVTALIDNSAAANWYTELCEGEYQSSLITKKNGKGLNEKENPAEEPANQEEAQEVSETIIAGIQIGEDVWGSGTTSTKNEDGTFKVVAAGEGQGSWGGNIAAVPVRFDEGDFTGYKKVILEADLSTFNLNENNDEYPPIELKLINNNDSKTKVFNATNLFKDKKAVIDISTVDFLSEVTKILFSFRGPGYLTIKDISKAK